MEQAPVSHDSALSSRVEAEDTQYVGFWVKDLPTSVEGLLSLTALNLAGGSTNEACESDATFLGEIIEMTAATSLKDSRPQRLFEWPEFMSMRCQAAKKCLKEKIHSAAKLRIYGFVPSLPLYSFDVNKSLLRRPALSEVKSLPFKEFVEYIHGLGFSCFIDRPGLEFWCNQNRNKASFSKSCLSDFGLYDFQYYDAIGAPKPQRRDLPEIQWVLYVLLPGQATPDFCLKRYFRYNQARLSVGILFLKVFTGALLFATLTLPMLILLSGDSEYYYGNPPNEILE